LDTLDHLLEVKDPNYVGLGKRSRRREKDNSLNKVKRDDVVEKKEKTKNKVN
jgi:hypothetical protein